jgi:hypothetical protein
MTDDSELELATPDDFLVGRSDDDELQPVIQALPGVEESVRVVPLTLGDANDYGDANGNIDPNSLSNDEIAEILNEHWYDLRESDRDLDGDSIGEDMIAFGTESLLTAILRASGFDLQKGLNMDNLETLEKIPEGKLETMMELSDQV